MNTKTSDNNMVNSSNAKKRIQTSEDRLGRNKRTTPVNILVPSNNNSSNINNNRTSDKDATVQYLLENQIRIEAVLDKQDQLIQQLSNKIDMLTNTVNISEQRNLARMGQSTNKLALEDLPENVKALGTIIRQELEELPQNEQYDYNTTYKDQANKSTRDSLFAYGKIYSGQYSISDSRLKRILSEMFYNKKKELKLSIDKKEIRKIKSAVKSRKAAKLARRKKMIREHEDIYNEENYEGLGKLMIPSWMSDEEEIIDNDVDGNLIFKVLRPSFRSQMFNDIMDDLDYKWNHPEDPSKKLKRKGKLVRNSPVLTETLFPSYLDKEDFPDWAFST